MDQDDLKALREIYDRCQILLSFNGPFSQSVIEELGEAIRRHLESQTQPRKRIADVFSVYIEVAQNIRHYATLAGQDEEHVRRLNAGTVLIAREGEEYAVVSGNLVHRDAARLLSERLDHVNALSPELLKAAYKETLRKPVEEQALGAGLGLLQMARKSSRPLNYNLEPVDEEHVFFTLTVYI